MARYLLVVKPKASREGEIMASKIDNAFLFQQQALGLRAYRQQVLAGNIANSDTPHYKARDFDFTTALKEAMAGRGEGSLQVVRTHVRHFPGSDGDGMPNLKYRIPMQDSADGNTVEMDTERIQFSENAIHYQAGLTFITHQVKMLTAAMQAQS
jgi:flagellar basal-body rod protein FlgB